MGLMDKAKQAMRGRSEKLERGIDSAVGQLNQRTKGKYRDKLEKGAEGLKAQTRKLDDERPPGDEGDGEPPTPPPPGPRPTDPPVA